MYLLFADGLFSVVFKGKKKPSLSILFYKIDSLYTYWNNTWCSLTTTQVLSKLVFIVFSFHLYYCMNNMFTFLYRYNQSVHGNISIM